MGKLSIQRMLTKSVRGLGNNSATILTCLGAAGVVATAVMSVKATPKALILIRSDSRKNHNGDPYAYSKAEAIKSCWKCYIPAAAIGLSTIALIFGANTLNRRKQASLMSAYALLDRSYRSYRSKVKDMYGSDADRAVEQAAAKDEYSSYCKKNAEKKLFYDECSKKYIDADEDIFWRAENCVNYLIHSEGAATLADYKRELGLEVSEADKKIGWNCGTLIEWYGVNWVVFNHEDAVMDDGLECCIIYPDLYPSDENMEDWL